MKLLTETKFIAFAGKKQAGKNTAAMYLEEQLTDAGISFITTSFAEPLKEFCVNILGIPENQIYGSNEDKNQPTHILWENMSSDIQQKYKSANTFMTAREVMQIFGTDIVRNMDPYAWARAPFLKWADSRMVVIITDMRFQSELEMLNLYVGTSIRLNRDTGLQDNHVSETELDNASFDYVINNNESLNWLKEEVQDISIHEGLS